MKTPLNKKALYSDSDDQSESEVTDVEVVSDSNPQKESSKSKKVARAVATPQAWLVCATARSVRTSNKPSRRRTNSKKRHHLTHRLQAPCPACSDLNRCCLRGPSEIRRPKLPLL